MAYQAHSDHALNMLDLFMIQNQQVYFIMLL